MVRIENEVAFAERISNEVQICAEKIGLRMEMKEKDFFLCVRRSNRIIKGGRI